MAMSRRMTTITMMITAGDEPLLISVKICKMFAQSFHHIEF